MTNDKLKEYVDELYDKIIDLEGQRNSFVIAIKSMNKQINDLKSIHQKIANITG